MCVKIGKSLELGGDDEISRNIKLFILTGLVVLNYVVHMGNVTLSNTGVDQFDNKNYAITQVNLVEESVFEENENHEESRAHNKKTKPGMGQMLKDLKKITRKGMYSSVKYKNARVYIC